MFQTHTKCIIFFATLETDDTKQMKRKSRRGNKKKRTDENRRAVGEYMEKSTNNTSMKWTPHLKPMA